METLKEKLSKIDSYTFRNDLKRRLELLINNYRESNDKALLELSTLYEKKNIISSENVKKINYVDLIIENNIKIKEITSILKGI